MADKMGLSMSYIHQLEAGKRTPSDSVLTITSMMEELLNAGLVSSESNAPTVKEPTTQYGNACRMIPVYGWAHAGEAEAYEEMAGDWQYKVPTESRDPQAFAVQLEGDSMEPKFSEGDMIVVQPSEAPYSGCLVVARYADDGVIFRRFEVSGKTITLVPLNTRYNPTEHEVGDFSWIYPVWGRWTQVWRK